jgi:dihydroxyacetone kinase-like protein
MNQFFNSPDTFVAEMLEGIVLANPDKLKYVPRYRKLGPTGLGILSESTFG